MHRSADRILTTHTGSLHRQLDLEELFRKKLAGEVYDEKAFQGDCAAPSGNRAKGERRYRCRRRWRFSRSISSASEVSPGRCRKPSSSGKTRR